MKLSNEILSSVLAAVWIALSLGCTAEGVQQEAPEQAQEKPRGVAIVDGPGAGEATGRFVVAVVGIDDYRHWPKLDNAVADALGMAEILTEKFGFVAPVPPLVDGEATKQRIEELVKDDLRDVLEESDNLVLFFAGHGHTRVDRVGETELETGYLVPVEAAAGSEEKWSRYIEIDSLLKEVGTLPARHILVVLDSCHSGFALSGAQKLRNMPRYERSLATKVSRKVVTSARRDEQAIDSGPVANHSLFTGSLIEGLDRSQADLDDSDFITSSELGLFLQQTVGRYSDSKQTPDFGSFYLDNRGEMVIPISIGSSLAARKRRAFAALRRGELDRVRQELGGQEVTGPQLTYLKYRLALAGRDSESALAAVRELLRMDWAEGTLPLSRHDLSELDVRLEYWNAFLELSDGAFPLEVRFLAGGEAERLAPVEPGHIGDFEGYEIETGDFMGLEITNPTTETWHVYMMDIDQDGRINPVPLWRSDTQFDGLSAGSTERTYPFKHDGSAPGMSEFRLFAAPTRIRALLSPPSTMSRAAIPTLDASETAGVEVRAVVYRAVRQGATGEE